MVETLNLLTHSLEPATHLAAGLLLLRTNGTANLAMAMHHCTSAAPGFMAPLYSVSSACTMLRHQVSLPFVAPLASPVLSAHLSSSRRSHKSLRVVDSALGRSSLLGGMIGLTGTDSAASAFACAGVVVCHVVVCGGARGQHGGEADLNRSHRLWHWRRDRELLIGAIGHGIAAGRDRELLIGAIVYGIGAGIASY